MIARAADWLLLPTSSNFRLLLMWHLGIAFGMHAWDLLVCGLLFYMLGVPLAEVTWKHARRGKEQPQP